MTNILQGDNDGSDLNVAIIVSEFNKSITENLLEGTLKALLDNGVFEKDIYIIKVPGAFEIPLLSYKLASSGKFDVLVCIGAIIRGETGHYDFVASEAARGISRSSIDTGIPIIFGILTTDNVQQAVDRSGGKYGNKGYDCGISAIQIANIFKSI
jgi:6,7-dimethyl-8-ribityllumazine synthase